MKIKTSELTGAPLSWAVAKCEGHEQIRFRGCLVDPKTVSDGGALPTKWRPQTNWAQGGPIVERELGNLYRRANATAAEPEVWTGIAYKRTPDYTAAIHQDGPTPLIAAMRCYVASKLGAEVEIPDELISAHNDI